MPPDESRTTQSPNLPEARQEPRTIADIIKSKNTVERFKQIMPKHLSPERMMRVCAMAVNSTPDLAKCDAITLLGAMMACASFGLEPNTPLGHAYLIPFKKSKKDGNRWIDTYQVQLIIGYRGYIDLARRSGSMIAIHADVVYEGDEFSFEYGSGMHLRHVPKGARGDRKPLWAYAHAKLTDGEAFEVMPYAEVLDIRNGSQGYQAACAARDEAKGDVKKAYRMKAYEKSPWVAHEHEMAAKTMIRRVSKYLPLSLEFNNAVAVDGASDRGTLDLAAITIDPDKFAAGDVVESEEEENDAGGPADPKPKTETAGQEATQDPKPKDDPKPKAAAAEEKPAGKAKPSPDPEPEENEAGDEADSSQIMEPRQTASTTASRPNRAQRGPTKGAGLFRD